MPPSGAAPGGPLILASFSLPAGASSRVVSDAAQRPLLQSGGEMTTTVITYTYDALYRLTNATYSDGTSFQYTYDAVGNRLT